MNLANGVQSTCEAHTFSKPPLCARLKGQCAKYLDLPRLHPLIRGKPGSIGLNLLLALTLTLPALVLATSAGLKNASDNLQQSRRISVFVQEGFDAVKTGALADTLAKRPEFIDATVLDQRLVTTLLPATSDKPGELPKVLELTLTSQVDSNNLNRLVAEITALPGIIFVDSNAQQLDKHTEAARLSEVLSAASAALAIALTSLIITLLTRRDIRSHRHYLDVMNQQGASLSTLRIPFYYRSIGFAIIGAFFGSVVCWLGLKLVPVLVDISTFKQVLPGGLSSLQLASFLLVSLCAALFAVAGTRKIYTY